MNFKKRVNGSWADTPNYIHKTDTDIITTLPAVLYPTGTTATVGLKGQTLQSSVPSPTSPVTPQGTGDKTANLIESYISGCNINAGGGLIANAEFNMFIAKVEQGKTYCLDTTITVAGYFTTSPTIRSVSYDAQRLALSLSPFTAPIDGYLAYRKASSEKKAMMNEGNELLPYEPYGYKIPISSANTTTPVYLGEVETTRRVKKLVLTGDEAFSQPGTYPGGYLYMFIPSDIPGDNGANAVSTHYKQAYNNNGQNVYIQSGRIVIIDATHSTRDDFKSYLAAQYAAGTPVTVWYVLATEETGIVNEPLRKIGNYADEVSGITIPTIAGANTISVGTTLQPSEVSVNYKGWHPVADVHEAENGQWD